MAARKSKENWYSNRLMLGCLNGDGTVDLVTCHTFEDRRELEQRFNRMIKSGIIGLENDLTYVVLKLDRTFECEQPPMIFYDVVPVPPSLADDDDEEYDPDEWF